MRADDTHVLLVFDDNVNTMDRLVDCLASLPRITEGRAIELTMRVHNEGAAIVWAGSKTDAVTCTAVIADNGLSVRMTSIAPADTTN
ncbi:hypothetical protein KR51_00016380 [Rubidibacter lacunae KORDI 51-2]|uniref:Adaptor protein ClpS core domain-containing protein n=1 Tax=Rubidibacter lacunae KORDI 51-2 TaxID=582515 RepID=U5DJB5_9CHRO|nr:ATP-dependent Clp protease adaptor ClpS [Rubidibacter lacunae]ERN41786.1 hypothetical protein KR51_00016380 [Rubidibacter lacunae KORDI 51-2]